MYLAEGPAEAAVLLDKAIAGCADDDVEEIRSLGLPQQVEHYPGPRSDQVLE